MDAGLEELRRAFIAGTATDADWLVYAEGRQQKGDPHGELIALQHAITNAGPGDDGLRQAASALLERHRPALLGGLERLGGVRVTWKNGFLHGIHVSTTADAWEVFGILGEIPVARLLDDLQVEAIGRPEVVLDCLLRTGLVDTLRSLSLKGPGLGALPPLYPRLGRLRTLRLDGDDLDIGRPAMPHLESLALVGRIGRHPHIPLRLAEAKWPGLESFSLSLAGQVSMQEEVDSALPLCRTAISPRLRQMGLLGLGSLDTLLRPIAAAPWMATVRSLDLRQGSLSEAGGRYLAAHFRSFSRLERLHLPLERIPYGLRQELLGHPQLKLADPGPPR